MPWPASALLALVLPDALAPAVDAAPEEFPPAALPVRLDEARVALFEDDEAVLPCVLDWVDVSRAAWASRCAGDAEREEVDVLEAGVSSLEDAVSPDVEAVDASPDDALDDAASSAALSEAPCGASATRSAVSALPDVVSRVAGDSDVSSLDVAPSAGVCLSSWSCRLLICR